MSKRAKTVIKFWFGATTVNRLSSPEYVDRFGTIFDGVSTELHPTDIFLYEGKGGHRPFSLDAMKALDALRPRYLGVIELRCRGAIRGSINVGYGGCPPSDGINYTPKGNGIGANYDFAALVKHRLFENAMRLFWNIVEYMNACHGHAAIGAVSTAKYSDMDNPEYDKPYTVEWNGVFIEPIRGPAVYRGGPAVYCLPCFDEWINVLGREYVELLGRDKLLALDVHKKHEDSAGRIWLQITERPEQMYLPDVRSHVQRLMDSLEAQNVFCREPRTPEEREHGIKYGRPNFDWSGLEQWKPDPFSTERGPIGVNINSATIWYSEGYLDQIPRKRKRDLELIVETLLNLAVPTKGNIDPFGVALAEDGELIHIGCREPDRWTVQEKADTVTEGLAQLREQRLIKATGACFYGKGIIPGDSNDTTAFKIHLESAAGDAYVLYLPFEEKGRKREYGTLIIKPDMPTVFVSSSFGR